MGLVKFGGGVAGISGKIGGTVYGRNKAGSYARNWAKPVNPGTVRQSEVRSIFQTQSASWNALSPSEKAAWNSAASGITRVNRFGESYVPSGRQYHLEINNSLQQATQAGLTAPPVSPTPPLALTGPDNTATTTAGVLTTLDASWTSPTIAGSTIIIEATPPQPNNRSNVNNQYRQVTLLGAATMTPANILTAYGLVFGLAANPGDIISFRYTVLDNATGYRSAPLIHKVVVT